MFVLLAIAITKKMKKLESYPQEKQRKQSKMFIMNNHFGGEIMREEYDIMSLNPKKKSACKNE